MNMRTDFTVTQEQADTLNARIAQERGTTMTTTTQTPDTDRLARELKLYAQNTYELYEQYQSIERTTDARLDAGATEEQATAHAIHCLEGWLDKAAHMYGREVGYHAFPRFTMAAKAQAAEEIAEEIVDEYEYRKPYR